MTLWRIVDRSLVRIAFSGQGAFDYGGRWNSPGVRMVYCSEHPALAAFEKLVHIEDPDALRESFMLIPVECNDALVKPLRKRLPKDWDGDGALQKLRAIGDDWIRLASSVGLFVPSIALPRSDNILLNPAHEDFSELKIGRAVSFKFDPRLKAKA